MSSDRKSGEPRPTVPGEPTRPPAPSPVRLPSGGWTMGPWDSEPAPAEPAAAALQPVGLPVIPGARPAPSPAVDSAEAASHGVNSTASVSAGGDEDVSLLGDRPLDLGAMARSMSSIHRPSPRRSTSDANTGAPVPPRASVPPSTAGADSLESVPGTIPLPRLGTPLSARPLSVSPRPGMAPTTMTRADLPELDRGVSLPLPAGLSGVMRPSPRVRRPGQDLERAGQESAEERGLASLLADDDGENPVTAAAVTEAAPWRREALSASSAQVAAPDPSDASELPLSPFTLKELSDVHEFLLVDDEVPAPRHLSAPTPLQGSPTLPAEDVNDVTLFGFSAVDLQALVEEFPVDFDSDSEPDHEDMQPTRVATVLPPVGDPSITPAPLPAWSEAVARPPAYESRVTAEVEPVPANEPTNPPPVAAFASQRLLVQTGQSAAVQATAQQMMRAPDDPLEVELSSSSSGSEAELEAEPPQDSGADQQGSTVEVQPATLRMGEITAGTEAVADPVAVSEPESVPELDPLPQPEDAQQADDARHTAHSEDDSLPAPEPELADVQEVEPAPADEDELEVSSVVKDSATTADAGVAAELPLTDDGFGDFLPPMEAADVYTTQDTPPHPDDPSMSVFGHQPAETPVDTQFFASEAPDYHGGFQRGEVTHMEPRPATLEQVSAPAAVDADGQPVPQDKLIDLPLPSPSARELLELDPSTAHHSNVWMNDVTKFETLADSLRRGGRGAALASVLARVIDGAPFARGQRRCDLLLELGRLGRDVLANDDLAEESFASVLRLSPGDDEAYQHLLVVYESRADVRMRTQLELYTVPGLRSPWEQLARTSRAASAALQTLGDPELAIAAWEQLHALGMHQETCARELGRLYRLRAQWQQLAGLTETTASGTSGGARWLALRQLALIRGRAAGDAVGAAHALNQLLVERPTDEAALSLLVEQYAEAGELDALVGLNWSMWTELNPARSRTLRCAANALWSAGRTDHASGIYLRLQSSGVATDEESDRVDEWRASRGEHAARVSALVDSARASRSAVLWDRAATVAMDELSDWSRGAECVREAIALRPSPERSELLRRCLRNGQDRDARVAVLRECLQNQRMPSQRVPLLQELASVLEAVEPEQARDCLQEVLTIADSAEVRDQILALHQRLGDSEGLRSTSTAALERDHSTAASMWRRVAGSWGEGDVHAIDAWEQFRVYEPSDTTVNVVLDGLYLSASEGRRRALAIERQLSGAGSARQDLTLVLSSAWQGSGALSESACALERVVANDPESEVGLEALSGLYAAAGRPELARVVLEVAWLRTADARRRVAILRQAHALVPESDTAGRWAYESRMLWHHGTDRSSWSETTAMGVKAGAQEELLALVRRRHAQATDWSSRQEASSRLLALIRDVLTAPDAALAHVRAQVDPQAVVTDEQLASLTELCEQVGRHDEVLELLEQRVRLAESDERRVQCLFDLSDRLLALGRPAAAIWTLRRALPIERDSERVLQRLEVVVSAHGLRHERDELLLDLAALTTGSAHARMLQRWCESDTPMSDSVRFMRRMVTARLTGLTPRLMVDLSSHAAQLGVWPWVCAYFEAEAWGRAGGPEQAQALMEVSGAMSSVPECMDRAFELRMHVLEQMPEHDGALSGVLGQCVALSRRSEARLSLQQAASRVSESNPDRAVALLESALGLCESESERCRIAHQLLSVRGDHRAALELVVGQYRGASRWWDLHAGLLRLARTAEDSAEGAGYLREAATVSADHLEDPRQALELYGQASALHADAGDAARMDALIELCGTNGERLDLARRRASSGDGTQVELWVELARLQAQSGEFGDAVASLRLAWELGAPVWSELESLAVAHLSPAKVLELRAARAAAATAEERPAAWAGCLPLLHVAETDELRERILNESLAHGPARAQAESALIEAHLKAGRFEALATALGARMDSASELERRDLLFTRARLERWHLDNSDIATDLWLDVQAEDENDLSALVSLADLALLRGDHERAFEWLYKYAQLQVPRHAAVALCALAEFCDDHQLHVARIPDLYREARRLDPWCQPSSEALKGISRRLGRLRPSASLLSEAGEEKLSSAQRGERLEALAAAQQTGDEQRELLRRATALNPNAWTAWRELASLTDGYGSSDELYRLRLAAWDAFRRTHGLGTSEEQEVELGWQAALAAMGAGFADEFQRICRALHLVSPTYLPAAQVIAREYLKNGEPARALAVVEPCTGASTDGTDPAILSLMGDIYTALGDSDRALGWHERAVTLRPLAGNSLAALASHRLDSGDVASFHNLTLASLVAEPEVAIHANRMRELGDVLAAAGEQAEATACYEEAFNWGNRESQLLERLHEMYRTQPAGPRGEAVLEALLESGLDADRACSLHLALGRLLADQPNRSAQAIHHLESALGLDSEIHEARALLVTIHERTLNRPALRGVLEEQAKRAVGLNAAMAWMRLASLALEDRDETDTVRCLERSVQAHATVGALLELERRWASSEPLSARRRDVLARLAAQDEVCYPHVLNATRHLLESRTTVAWCALSPLLMTRSGEDDVRSRLRELRRDHERPPIRVAASSELESMLPIQASAMVRKLRDGLRILERAGLHVCRSAADAGGSEVFEVSAHSSMGRTFVAVAAQCGLNDVALHRAGDLPMAFAHWSDGRTLNVAVRADVFQSMARAEVGFVLVSLLTSATSPGSSVAGLSADRRRGFGLAVASWLTDEPLIGADIATIDALSSLPDEVREQVNEVAGPQMWRDAELLHQTAWVCEQAAMRRGLIAGPDLYQVSRALGRMQNDPDRTPSFMDLPELDRQLLSDTHLRGLAAFSASGHFEAALTGAHEVLV